MTLPKSSMNKNRPRKRGRRSKSQREWRLKRKIIEEREKLLAAQKEAGLLINPLQESSCAELNLDSFLQTSNAQTCTQHPNVSEDKSLQGSNFSQIPQSSTAVNSHTSSFATSAVESSSAIQPIFNVQNQSKNPNDYVNKIFPEVIFNKPQDTSCLQTSVSSSTVKDNYTVSYAKCAVESSNTAQETSINKTYSNHTNYPVHKTPQNTNIVEKFSVPQTVAPLQVSLSLVTAKKHVENLPFESAIEISKAEQKVSNNTVVNSTATQKVSNNITLTVLKTSSIRTYSKLKNMPVYQTLQETNTREMISSVHQNINSSKTSLSPAATKNNYALPFSKSAAERSNATQTVSNSGSFTSPSVCGNNLPTVSKSNPEPVSKISIYSSSFKTVSDHKKLLHTHPSIATQVTLNAKNSKTTKLNPLPNEAPIRGRRIIDFHYFFRALKDLNNHSAVGCNLNNMIVTSEKKSGLCTSYNLKCVECNFEREVWSENLYKKKNLNTQFVSAILNLKFNFREANLLLAKLQLPTLSTAVFHEEREALHKSDSNKINKNIPGKNVQKESQLTAMEQCSSTEKNAQREPQSDIMQQSSSASDNDSLLEQVNLGGLLVEDQFEVEEENIENENESETIIPYQSIKTSDNKFIDGQEGEICTTIKQEVISDDEDLITTTTTETPDKENIVTNNEQSLLQAKLPQQNVARTCENKVIADQEDVKLQKKLMIETMPDSSVIVKPYHNDIKIMNKGSITDFDNELVSELPFKKVKTGESNNNGDAKKMQTAAPMKEIVKFCQSKLQTSGLETPTSSTTCKENEPATSSVASGESLKAATSLTNSGNIMYLIPTQHMSKSSGHEALIIDQVPQNLAGGTYQGAKGAAFISGTSSMVQQQSSSGLLSFVPMQQSWTNNFNPSISNPLILFPGISGATYIPGISTAIQQSTNAVPNISGATYVPLISTVVQQPVNSSNSIPGGIPTVIQKSTNLSKPQVVQSTTGTAYVSLTPPVVQQPVNSSAKPPVNTDGTRWIGRANMKSNNPFCTLPGGASKDSSDSETSKSNSTQPQHKPKRPRFRCDDCDINFAKYESWDSHKKVYCIKRLKLPPSSTVTNETMNNPLPPNYVATASLKPHIEELLSAMAVKRSFLEASMKTALDAQYVINLHKSAQDLTQKSFKELDNALNREKALMPEASLEEQQAVSEARAQALLRAEAAYKQEKRSAAAVEQALYRQKTAIEATLAATGHEQTALILTLKGLKVPASQNDLSSIFQGQCSETNFNQENLIDTLTAGTAEQQQVVDSVSSKTAPAHTTSHASVSHFDVHSEKFGMVNFDESKVTMDSLSDDSHQCKEIDAMVSCSSSNASSFQKCEKGLQNAFNSEKDFDLNVPEKSPSPEYENEIVLNEHSHLGELKDLSARVFSKNTYVTVYQADKCFTQKVNSDEMMDINITPSSESIQISNSDIHQDSVSLNFLHEERKQSDDFYTLTEKDPQSDI